jgi:hypothetical protein
MAIGQCDYPNRNVRASELRRETFGGVWATAVDVSVEGQAESSIGAAQLLKLRCIQMAAQ